MVTYSEWVGIVRSTAERKGADVSDFETNSAIVSVAADLWRQNKTDLERMGRSAARGFADGEVTVR